MRISFGIQGHWQTIVYLYITQQYNTTIYLFFGVIIINLSALVLFLFFFIHVITILFPFYINRIYLTSSHVQSFKLVSILPLFSFFFASLSASKYSSMQLYSLVSKKQFLSFMLLSLFLNACHFCFRRLLNLSQRVIF